MAAWRITLASAAILRAGVAASANAAEPAADPWAACGEAAAQEETAAGLPPGLLRAIGVVETGRAPPGATIARPWPFSVNVEGAGRYFPDAASAIDFVQAAQARGARSIDVGCFQVNLQHHPQAFASLSEGFDPARNAQYAARLLARHYAASGSWDVAAGNYHSMNPGLAIPYAARVVALWRGEPALAGPPSAVSAWPVASAMRAYRPVVWLPGGPQVPPTGARPRLPAVFVPGQR